LPGNIRIYQPKYREKDLTKQIMRPVSVVVPTLNEVNNLPLLFKRIKSTLNSAQIPYEIIVVDDHSNDGTQNFVIRNANKYNAILMIKEGLPGKAFSLLEGFNVAKNEIICMIDADLQYPPEAIKLMYHKLQYLEADIVLTNRLENHTSWFRKLTTFTFNFVFTKLLFGIGYDTQSGLKMFRKEVLNSIQLSPSPWTFDLEFIVRALENNYVITSQDIVFSERYSGAPKINIFKATLEIAGGSLRLWREISPRHIRMRYKYLENMHSKMLGIFIGLFGLVIMLGVSQPKISALSLNNDYGVTTQTANDILNNSDKTVATVATGLISSSEAATATTDPVNDDSSSITYPVGSTVDSATNDLSDNASTTSISPTATSTNTPTTASTTASKSSPNSTISTTGSSKSGNGNNYSTPVNTAGDSNTGSSSQTISTPKDSGSPSSLYNNNKLSSHTTSFLIKTAEYMLFIAAGFLIAGGMIVTFSKWIRKTQRHQLLWS
jgi:glycosyltransferase involved in cell wall biosynthesis